MIKRILLGLGGTPFTAVAIRRAVELAKTHGAEVTAVTVVDVERLEDVGGAFSRKGMSSSPIPDMDDSTDVTALLGTAQMARDFVDDRFRVTQKRVEEAGGECEAACARAGVPYRIKHETGDPFELMASYARYHDLVIFGLRSLFDYGIVDEPRDALVRLISQGVRPILAAASEYREIKRVLIAYSGSVESAGAMKRFVQLRLWGDVPLQIVCCEKDRGEGKRELEAAAGYCSAHGFEVGFECLEGSPEERLLLYAEECEADLIVMGNSIRSLLFRHLLGDTMLHAIRNADRPLFLGQ